MKINFVLCLVICFSLSTFAQTAKKNEVYNYQLQPVVAIIKASGEPEFYAQTAYGNVPLSNEMLKIMTSSLAEKAKVACSEKILPQSVTLSIGFLSLTWDMEKLCKSK